MQELIPYLATTGGGFVFSLMFATLLLRAKLGKNGELKESIRRIHSTLGGLGETIAGNRAQLDSLRHDVDLFRTEFRGELDKVRKEASERMDRIEADLHHHRDLMEHASGT